MKEIKTFFDKNNKLNKGYIRPTNTHESDSSFYQKKFAHILPPIDIINEYENIHPGTLARLIDMAEKEQHHRQALDLVNLDAQTRAFKMGRNFALVFVGIACLTTIALAIIASAYIGIIFASVAFAVIGAISFLPLRKNIRKTEEVNFQKQRQTPFRKRKR